MCIYIIDTLSTELLHTQTNRMQAVPIIAAVSMGTPKRTRISITANYLHPSTLKDTAWSVETVFLQLKDLFLLTDSDVGTTSPYIWLRNLIVVSGY